MHLMKLVLWGGLGYNSSVDALADQGLERTNKSGAMDINVSVHWQELKLVVGNL